MNSHQPRIPPMKSNLAILFFAPCFAFTSLAFADESVTVIATVVDDETGKPITAMMIQAGKIDAKDPKKITWGYSERNTRSKTGRISTNIRWSQGWTARVVADGYLPYPILTKAPKPGEKRIEMEIRLKKGKPVTGTIVDHNGKPVSKAKVFAVSARGLNLYDGEARDRYDGNKIDTRAKYVETDKDGKFQIHPGGSSSIAVCAPTIDAYAVAIDPSKPKPLQIKLPAPTKVKIKFEIPHAGEESDVFYQFLSHLSEGYKKINSTRTLKVKNGQTVELNSLPPGKYQFVRQKMHHFGSIGMGAMLDRTFIEVKSGETTEINFVRSKGKRLEGVVRLPKEANLGGVILTVLSLDEKPQPWSKVHKNRVIYSSQLIAGKPQKTIEAKEVAFKTEFLNPGKYVVRVVGYKRLTPAEMRMSGWRLPEFEVTTKTVTVTESGAPNMMIIELKPRDKSKPAKPIF